MTTPTSRFWFRLTLLWVLLGVARAHHFFRLVVLATLGLAGLWMVHTLAQDFSAIQSQQYHPYDRRELYKRDAKIATGGPVGLDVIYVAEPDPAGTAAKPGLDWERVLSRDPFGCARSFLCQLAATEERGTDEELMLRLVGLASPNEGRAVAELQGSVRKGEELRSASACMRVYRYCPYSSQVMMRLIKFFGRSP